MNKEHQQAIAALQSGDINTSFTIARKLHASTPSDPDVNLLMAAVYAAKQEYESVLTYCDRVIEVQPDNDRALFNAAVASAMLERNDISIEYLKAILSRQAAHPAALKMCVDACRKLKKHEESMDLLQAALKDTGMLPPDLVVELGITYFNLNDYQQAEAVLTGVPAGSNRYAEACHYLGNIHEKRNRLEQAIQAYRETISLKPDSIATIYNLALLYEKTGSYSSALECIRRCVNGSDYPLYRRVMIRLLTYLDLASIDSWFVDTIIGYLYDDSVDMQPLSRNICEYLLDTVDGLRDVIDGAQQVRSVQMQTKLDEALLKQLASNDVLIAMLSNVMVYRYDFECLLLALRSTLLNMVKHDAGFDEALEPLSHALSIQCLLNGFVYFVDEDERSDVETLRKNLLSAPATSLASSQSMIILSMYATLEYWGRTILIPQVGESASTLLNKLYKYHYTDPLTERTIIEQNLKNSSIVDDVSLHVMEMYEKDPYPVWKKTDLLEQKTVYESIIDLSPFIEMEFIHQQSPSILIAGCGTGRHAILVAMRSPDSAMDAIDLSRNSLAYAQRMSEEQAMSHIAYRHMDILDVASLNKSYDIVESVGVLHHMDEPHRGLECLVDVMNPGAVINIGLYSTRGRRYIKYIKDKYAHIASFSDDDIRRLRKEIMENEDDETTENLSRFYDFYSLQECRDMLFHVQERTYTLDEISAMVDYAGLKFLAFGLVDAHTGSLYRTMFPQDEAMNDLENWDRLEQEHPDIFSSMYIFWCQKPL